MCLIFVSYQQHPDYPLIVAANRDEFYARPSTAIHQWRDNNDITAGKDIEKGGTWLGLSRQGRFAAVTNYRNGRIAQENRKSRGELVLELLSSAAPDTFVNSVLATTAKQYNDFNCFYFQQQALYYLSNKSPEVINKLKPGVYGLSNALLDTPWPKLDRGKAEFTAATAKPENVEAFWTLLTDETPARDMELPDTGVSREWEKLLSPRFIRSDDYGTRSCSLLFWSVKGEVALTERCYNARGFLEENAITLQMDGCR